jgi:hypothetical protein
MGVNHQSFGGKALNFPERLVVTPPVLRDCGGGLFRLGVTQAFGGAARPSWEDIPGPLDLHVQCRRGSDPADADHGLTGREFAERHVEGAPGRIPGHEAAGTRRAPSRTRRLTWRGAPPVIGGAFGGRGLTGGTRSGFFPGRR